MINYVGDVMQRFSKLVNFDATGSKEECLAYLLSLNPVITGEKDKGVIVGLIGPNIFNPRSLVATEVIWWVEPRLQGSGYGIRLLKTFEAKCKSLGCTKLVMSAIENSNDMAINIYPRLGYTKLETLFVKDI